ncbi:DNA-protecting protein DprA [Candidatus Saccharibacteria bacterium]|nr:MAG: DNA-protecting protein DprA [Candidatus Saccharibacteria bacterium]PID99542.1 MAG: DNA-protecting protein DprA [Candidatus Saccharibacteria bacterium]
MKVKKVTLNDNAYPSVLKDIASPPKELYYLGAEPAAWLKRPRVAIVGSRAITPYGKIVTTQLAAALAERNISIVSGLALGVDAVAHQAATQSGGLHIAVLANGLNQIYPASNTSLARKLLEQGGTIISEYPEGMPSLKQNFVARNRIIAGLADALLITEASDKSGTLHTARFAMEQGRDVMVVPGNITSPNSVGCNQLIKSGATPVTSLEDILFVLGAKNLATTTYIHKGDTPEEQLLLDLLYNGVSDAHDLLMESGLTPTQFSQTLTMLELSGKINPLGNNHWAPA